jgi:hypothetical protein
MTVHYDRATGADSLFTITLTSPTGELLRREQYPAEEIYAHVRHWNDDERLPGDDPELPTAREIREMRMTAATQPLR